MMKSFTNRWKNLCIGILGVCVLSMAVAPSVAQAQGSGGQPPSADSRCGGASFLGFPAWYRGLAERNANGCDIKSPEAVGGLSNFIWIIVFNVVEMLLRAAGYASVAFIIYGGYKYMISTGSADGVAGAKKTITNAVIGLVISIAAVAIVNTISGGIGLGG